MKIKEYLQQQKLLIDQALNDYLPGLTERPEVLHQAMRYSVLSNGKRIRPILLLATYQALNGTANVVPAACSLEFIHCFSLIHDDLPIMDNDDYRRGILTCHKKFGDAIALLAGDALLTHAFQIIAKEQSKYTSASIVVKLIKELAEATSTQGIMGGQAVDILAEKDFTLHCAETLEYIHRQKTAALLVAAVRMGAILAKATDRQLQLLGEAAGKIGLAYQIKDDILDITGDQVLLGKATGRDEALGKLTYPVIYGLDYATARCKELLAEAVSLLDFLGNSGTRLRILFRFLVERRY